MLKKSVTLIILASCALPSLLQSQDRPEEPLVRASLFVSSSSVDGGFDMGIHFEIEPEWYLYWINPGDAGLTVDVEWELPRGWKAGPLRFPTPEKIVKGGITAYGYHRELVLLSRMTPAAGAAQEVPGVVRVKLDWLVCRESCLPGRAELEMSLDKDSLARHVVSRNQLSRYQDRFPLALPSAGIGVDAMDVAVDGSIHLLRIPLRGERAREITDFYPEPIEGFSVDFSTIRVSSDRIQMSVTPHSSSSILGSVRGIAILGTKGYYLEAQAELE